MKYNRKKIGNLLLIVFVILISYIVPVQASSRPSSDSKGWTAPTEAKKLKNPIPATKDIIQLGKKIYQLQCATCHGTSGKGDGMAGKFLPKKPANFLLPEFQKQTDGEIFWKITHGRTPMPAFKDILSEEQRWQIVRYLRTLKPKKSK
ncbi:MAG: c-type cytochrome [candidate division KSB1 bacterium]|nr:c-type cytochrome [candidate division KSB1 bacterium]